MAYKQWLIRNGFIVLEPRKIIEVGKSLAMYSAIRMYKDLSYRNHYDLFQGKAFLRRPKQNGGLRPMRGECGLTKGKPVVALNLIRPLIIFKRGVYIYPNTQFSLMHCLGREKNFVLFKMSSKTVCAV